MLECVTCHEGIRGEVIYSMADDGPFCDPCWKARLRGAGRVIVNALTSNQVVSDNPALNPSGLDQSASLDDDMVDTLVEETI